MKVIHDFMLSVHSSFQAMASSEDRAYEIMRELDVNYVLVIFGGLTGYASDGKFMRQRNQRCHQKLLYFYTSKLVLNFLLQG